MNKMDKFSTKKGILWAEVAQKFPAPLVFDRSNPSHITLEYSAEYDKSRKYLGREYFVDLKTKLWNHKIEIVLVDLPSKMPFKEKQPFILLSWREGTKPTVKDGIDLINSWKNKEPVFCQDVSHFGKIRTVIAFYKWSQQWDSIQD